MERREVLFGLGLGAAAAGTSGLVGAAAASAQGTADGPGAAPAPLGPYGIPPVKATEGKSPQFRDIAPVSDDYFVPNRFKGRTAIVTGCARGMGRMAAIRLAREGANVVGNDWLKGEGETIIKDIVAAGGKAQFVYGDCSDSRVTDAMVAAAARSYGGLHACLNNAGVMDAIFPGDPIDYPNQVKLSMNPIHQASDEYWDVVMRVNATGVFKCMRSQLRYMVEKGQGGSIVNVSSVAGIRGFGGTPSYVASKHAVTGLTKNAAIDYAPYGIRVNSVHMANTHTPMVERAMQLVLAKRKMNPDRSNISMYKTKSLLQYSASDSRDATAAEQVAIMLFLMSPESSNITGANWATDGGYSTF